MHKNHSIFHNNDHSHSRNRQRDKKGLIISLSITVTIFIAELIGGFLSSSLALISDAVHMLTDTFSLILSLVALNISTLKANSKKSFGYYRIEILSALFNALLLFLLSFFIAKEGIERLLNPKTIKIDIMLAISVIGLIANFIGVYILSKSKRSLNVKGAYLHMLGDTLSSFGVIVGGIIILFTNLFIVDTLISFIVCIIIIVGAIKLLLEAVSILMESTPKHINSDIVKKSIEDIEGVISVYDLHIWSLTNDVISLSAHVVIKKEDLPEINKILKFIKDKLFNDFHIEHTTLQVESPGFNCVCTLEEIN